MDTTDETIIALPKRAIPITDLYKDSHKDIIQYEYLDHTADIQLHTWGNNLEEALEQQILAMMNYMTELKNVDINPCLTVTLNAIGHDLFSLIYNFMDELLYKFHSDDFITKKCQIIELINDDERKIYTIKAVCHGELIDLKKHPQGTEVKAITYSAMQVKNIDNQIHAYVVVDI